ncbi:MAG: M1 family metallopeptidase [Gemmatimonadaceae bacterium]|nr:M1 family metallopeptidase [Gemmatimonadaceae bacterium]
MPRLMRRPALLALVALTSPLAAQTRATWPERAVRRDIPMTNAIRRAFAAGTRDSTGRPGRNYWQLKTDYTIQVKLDVATARLTGTETIAVHNGSPDTLKSIGLRLPGNHFLFESPRAAPWVPAENTDGMVVTRLAVNGAAGKLTPTGNAPPPTVLAAEPTLVSGRSTAARIALASALAPGASASIEIDWTYKLPGGPGSGHRMTMRWADSLYQPTQWFPRVAVYDDLRGWDTELYLGPSEFYNDFGRYDVKIDVPAGWIVSGTGELQNPAEVLTPAARERLSKALTTDDITTIVGPDEIGPGAATAAGDRLVWHKVAENVNDFAWATARKYVWTATRATIPGKGVVPIHMMYLPGRERLFTQAGPVSRHALEFYSRLWFPYEFPQLTLQDGPSAGMEYPMVINSNVGAADHEAAHQWWPMVVSNNETWYGWMDEGFNQYMNILSAADAQQRAPVLDGYGQSYGRTAGNEAEPPMMWNANYAGPGFYGFQTYTKTPLMLSMLGGVVGDTAVQRAHREWAVAWKYKHPSPWDWMFFMQNALKRDLGWFWNAWLFGTESVDGSIVDVKASGAKTVVTVRQAGQMPSPVVLRVQLSASGAPVRAMANAVKVNETTYDVTWPVDVWFSGRRTFDAELTFGRAVEKVLFDPGCRFPDRDPSDNVWPRQTGQAAPAQAVPNRPGGVSCAR